MSELLRERAELHVLRLIRDEQARRGRPPDPPWRRGPSRPKTPLEAREKARRSFVYALEALTALGALPAEEGPVWRARYDSAKPREAGHPKPASTLDPETARRARRLLDERLPPPDLDKESDAHRAAVWRYEDALAAIRVTGALSAAEQTERSIRLDERLNTEERRKRHEAWRCKAIELVRVLTGPFRSSCGGVTLTHVELYADGLIVHWHMVVPYPRPTGRRLSPGEHRDALRRLLPPPAEAAQLELEDDLGTSYHWMPGPSSAIADGEDALVYWMSATLTPPVPPEATQLLARHKDATFEIGLTD